MLDTDEVVRAWSHAGNQTAESRLHSYARALTASCSVGGYRTLSDIEEDRALLALYRVDRPHATVADVHQCAPLALASYHQLLHDLAREGLGPVDSPAHVRVERDR